MTNVTEKTEALAQQLYALYWEALGKLQFWTWEELKPEEREAWVQIAQFIDARTDEPDHK